MRTGSMCNIAVGAWIDQWWNWNGCSATDSFCHYQDTNSTEAQCFEEVGYEQHTGDTMHHLLESAYPE